MERSHAKVRGDVAHRKLVAMGYQGSERTTRRALAEAKRRWRAGHRRRTRPWITEPGLWMQWDYGTGPEIDGRATTLFCAWLAWSRFRVVIALRDRSLPSVEMALDRALRVVGGAPTYALTDMAPDGCGDRSDCQQSARFAYAVIWLALAIATAGAAIGSWQGNRTERRDRDPHAA